MLYLTFITQNYGVTVEVAVGDAVQTPKLLTPGIAHKVVQAAIVSVAIAASIVILIKFIYISL